MNEPTIEEMIQYLADGPPYIVRSVPETVYQYLPHNVFWEGVAVPDSDNLIRRRYHTSERAEKLMEYLMVPSIKVAREDVIRMRYNRYKEMSDAR